MRADRPSHTAGTVAQSLLVISHDPVYGSLVPVEAVQPTRWLLQAARGRGVRLLDMPWMIAFARFYERLLLPGVFIHHAARKVWIEARVRQGLEDGSRQVVILGAGYDTLIWRIHKHYPDARFFEVDHPATQSIKRKVIEERADAGPNLRLVSVDLSSRSLRKVIEELEGFSCDDAAIFVIEGVLMYLTETQIVKTIQAIRACSGPESILLGTELRPDASGKPSMGASRRVINWMLRMTGEQFKSALNPEQMVQVLKDSGYHSTIHEVAEVVASAIPHEGALPRLPTGEYLFDARL